MWKKILVFYMLKELPGNHWQFGNMPDGRHGSTDCYVCVCASHVGGTRLGSMYQA